MLLSSVCATHWFYARRKPAEKHTQSHQHTIYDHPSIRQRGERDERATESGRGPKFSARFWRRLAGTHTSSRVIRDWLFWASRTRSGASGTFSGTPAPLAVSTDALHCPGSTALGLHWIFSTAMPMWSPRRVSPAAIPALIAQRPAPRSRCPTPVPHRSNRLEYRFNRERDRYAKTQLYASTHHFDGRVPLAFVICLLSYKSSML